MLSYYPKRFIKRRDAYVFIADYSIGNCCRYLVRKQKKINCLACNMYGYNAEELMSRKTFMAYLVKCNFFTI